MYGRCYIGFVMWCYKKIRNVFFRSYNWFLCWCWYTWIIRERVELVENLRGLTKYCNVKMITLLMLTNHCDIMKMRKMMLMSEYIMHSFHFLPCSVIVSVPVCWPTILIAGSNTLINHHHSSFCHHWKPHFHYYQKLDLSA